MIRVAIVDDENIVRLGLKSLIDWEANGFQIINVFGSAEEAFGYFLKSNLTKQLLPQIIITDIKMHGESGIELIKKVKKINNDIKFIVLSNYDDFKLVSDAFKEGAEDYLLKEAIEPHNLLSILDKIKNELAEAGREAHDGHGGTSQLDIQEQKNAFLNAVINKRNLAGEEYIEMAGAAGLDFQPFGYVCMIFHLAKNDFVESDEYNGISEHVMNNIAIVLSDACSKYGSCCIAREKKQSFAVLVSLPENKKSSPVTAIIKNISDSLAMYFGVESRVSCSEAKSGIRNTKEAYLQAVNASYAFFYSEESDFSCYGDMDLLMDIPRDISEKKREISTALSLGNFHKAIDSMSNIFTLLKGGYCIYPNIIKSLFINIVSQMKEYIIQSYDGANTRFDGEKYQKMIDCIWESQSLGRLEVHINSFVAQAGAYIDSNALKNNTMSNIKEYIREHYSENLTLKYVANNFYINPNYLSQQFKEKTGENFSNFLRRIKIEEAAKMIGEKHLSIEEAAESVGYNTTYFIKAFKRETGLTITEFRKRFK